VKRSAVAGLVLLLSPVASAQAQWQLNGHVKYQFALQHFGPDDFGALLIAPTPVDHKVDARLNAVYRLSRVDLTTAGELLTLAGDTIEARGSQNAGPGDFLFGLPDVDDTRQWMKLGHREAVGDRAELVTRMDRLSFGYTGAHFVARLGRQALSWGNGLVFQTLDLFDPFPPNVLDTDYKPGRDMLTTQWLLAGGDDVQAIVVPGRERRGLPLSARQSSAAAKWHHFAGGAETDLLVARHDGDTVLGGGVSRSLAGGVWRIDVSHVLYDSRHATSLVANFDRSWTPGGRNLYAFLEYFHNGFGVADSGSGAISLDPALLARLERGEIFTLGRDELAGGARFEWTPLLTLSPTAIVNLRDGSTFALLQTQYDWRQNLVLSAGLQTGIGSSGTEYRGVAVNGLPGYLSPGVRVWARLARYF